MRRGIESLAGQDLSGVRVHAGHDAALSAQAVDAAAYTLGDHIVFGRGEYSPNTSAGRALINHELVHVVQQRLSSSSLPRGRTAGDGIRVSDPADAAERQADGIASAVSSGGTGSPPRITASAAAPQVQRLVRTASVACPAAAAGVAAPHTGPADRRASALLTNALVRIDAARLARPANPADPDVVAVGTALHTTFRLNPANDDTWNLGAPNVRLPVIRRRVEAARDYIDSVVFNVNCVAAAGAHVIPGCAAGACAAGTEAFSCHTNATDLVLCPPFWAGGLDQRGRVWAHEVFHMSFGFIDDWGQPDVHNAHCYAQFVALLNGFNSPAGFRCH